MFDTKAIDIPNAVNFAAKYHKNQMRKDGVPFINHPIEVAHIISEKVLCGEKGVVAAYLHDVVEDTECTIEDIRKEFGNDVARIVELVTDDKSLSQIERKKAQVVHSKEMAELHLPGYLCYMAISVKMADMISNMRDLIKNPIWGPRRVQGYFTWKKAIIDNLSKRCPVLAKLLDELYEQEFIVDGVSYPAYDPTMNVEEYYQILENKV